MTLRTGTLAGLLAGTISATHVQASRPPVLPPEAALHNDRGAASITAGDYQAAVPELLRAYAAMPDAVTQRSGRGQVLGSLRSALHRLYTDTGDIQHLCRLQALLREHIEALLIALDDAARPEDVAGSVERLREVDERVGTRCSSPPQTVTQAPEPLSKPRPNQTTPPARPVAPADASSRGSRTAGVALMGVSVAAFTTMAIGIGLHADSRSKLQALARRIEAGEQVDVEDLWPRLYDRGRSMRGMAIAGGVLGAASLITGAALHGVSRRNARRARVTPVYAAGQVGVQFDMAF